MATEPQYQLRLKQALDERDISFWALTKKLARPNAHHLSYNAIYRLCREQPRQIGLDTLAKIQWAVKDMTGELIPLDELWEYTE